MVALNILILLWMCDCVFLEGPHLQSTSKYDSIIQLKMGSETMKNESNSLPSSTVSTSIFKPVTPTVEFQDAKTDFLTTSSSLEEKSAALTLAASGVISFIVILVVIVVILVCVVSLRFKCHRCKGAEADKQKPLHPIVTYSCSDAENPAGMKNVLLVSMKDLNTSNRKDGMKPMFTCEE